MSATDFSGGNTDTPSKPVSRLRILLSFVVVMSVFVFIRLSRNEAALLVALALITILETVSLVRKYRATNRLQATSEAAWFVVMLSIFLGVYRHSLMDHGVFVFATIFYRGYYTLYCNLRVALGIGLLIMAVVLPITCGIVTHPGFVEPLTAAYALLVASLWAFCSKLGAMVFGFEKSSTS